MPKFIPLLVNKKPLDGTQFVAPFVPCPDEVLDWAFTQINDIIDPSSDTIMDLGCGDGRVLKKALQYVQRVMGVELDCLLFDYAVRNLRDMGVQVTVHDSCLEWEAADEADHESKQALMLKGDIFEVDLCKVKPTILVLFLLPAGLKKLEPSLRKWLNGNVRRRVYTIRYEIPGMEPNQTSNYYLDDRYRYTLHMYQ